MALVFHYVNYELSYEKSYPNYQNIYRLGSTKWASTSLVFSKKVEEEFDEIKSIGRLCKVGSRILGYKDESTVVSRGYYANNELVSIFSFSFLRGYNQTALSEEYSVILTKNIANKLFKHEDPLGKYITLNNDKTYKVTGVINNLPTNSHLKVDYLISFPTIYKELPKHLPNSYHSSFINNYVLLDNKLADSVNKKLQQYTYTFWHNIYESVTQQYIDEDKDYYGLQNITSIRLSKPKEAELSKSGNVVYIYILVTLGIIIFIIASINFFNHIIVQLLRRAKELNVRKALGASHIQLIAQFLIEVSLALIAIGICSALISTICAPLI